MYSGTFLNYSGQFMIFSIQLYLEAIDGSQALKSGRIWGGSQALNWWLPSIRIITEFIVMLIFAVGGAVAGLVLGAGGGVLLHKHVLNTEGILTLLQLSLIGLLYTAIYGSISIPLVFKFGAERACMLMLASFIAPSAIFYGIYKLLVGIGIDFTEDMIPILLCIAPVIVVIWVAVMFKLSCYIFSKQEL